MAFSGTRPTIWTPPQAGSGPWHLCRPPRRPCGRASAQSPECWWRPGPDSPPPGTSPSPCTFFRSPGWFLPLPCSRMSRAIRWASSLVLRRLMLYAIRNFRAPAAVAPQEGTNTGGP
uniref:Uncharacterized protein n=1 Tax=Anguilla anguilla TaxID=7936 RepID=A0A0E9PRT3_ANGAN